MQLNASCFFYQYEPIALLDFLPSLPAKLNAMQVEKGGGPLVGLRVGRDGGMRPEKQAQNVLLRIWRNNFLEPKTNSMTPFQQAFEVSKTGIAMGVGLRKYPSFSAVSSLAKIALRYNFGNRTFTDSIVMSATKNYFKRKTNTAIKSMKKQASEAVYTVTSVLPRKRKRWGMF